MPDDKQTAFLQALTGSRLPPPQPSSPDENLLSSLVYQNLSARGLGIPMHYSFATDQTNGKYRVRTLINGLNGWSPYTFLLTWGAGIGDKLYFPVLFSLPWNKITGKVAKKAIYNRIMAKSWTDDYDPAVDGILTPENAPTKEVANPSTWNLGSDGTKLQAVFNTNAAIVSEEGGTVYYRHHLTIVYEDLSERHIWSSQINITNVDGVPQVSFVHDDNGDPDTIVAGGWARLKHTWEPDVRSALIPSRNAFDTYSLFFNNLTTSSELTSGDPCMVIGPEAFVYNDKACSLAQWLRTGNGYTFFGGVMSDPGILETQ